MMIPFALAAMIGLAACEETVVVDAPVAARLEVQAGGTPVTQAVATFVATRPAVRVTDPSGTPIAGAQVVFLATLGRGSVLGGEVTTGTDGIATVGSWRYGLTAGPQELSAAVVSSTSDARVTFTGTAVPGPTVALSITPASFNLLPGQTRQLTVNAVDAYGNPTGTAVAATFTSLNTAIATVSPAGLVTATGFGFTSIVASYQGSQVTASVGVGTRPSGTDVVNSTLESRPYSVAISPQGTVYAVRVDASDFTRYDLPSTSSSSSTSMAAAAYDIAFLPSGNLAYAVNVPGYRLSVIDRATNTVLRTISGLGEPYRLKASPDGSMVYVSNSTGDLHRISTTNDAVTTLAIGGIINGLALNPARDVLYASTYQGVLHEISLSTFTLLRSVTVGGQMQGMTVSANGEVLFIANETSGLQVVNTTTLSVANTLGSLAGAFDVLLTADGAELYVSRAQAGVVAVLNAQTLSVLRTITGGTPRRMGITVDGLTVAIANEAGWVTFVR